MGRSALSSELASCKVTLLVRSYLACDVKTHLTAVDKVETALSAVLYVRFLPS